MSEDLTYSEEENDKVASYEGGKDAKVSPAVVEAEAEGGVELVTDAEGAVLAQAGGVVDQVARTAMAEKRGHVVAARHARRGGEGVELGRGADDG